MAKAMTAQETLNVPRYGLGSEEMESLLQAGYPDMDKETAQEIIQSRESNPQAYPFEMYRRAKAYMAALTTKPIAVDTEPAWEREIVA